MIKLLWKDKWIDFESATWSGTDTQCSRQLTFSIPWNPYDKEFKKIGIKLGDLVGLYDGSKQLFVGIVTSREKTAEIGTASYTAKDFMHYLLRSNGTYKFKGMTPEKITKKICSDLKITTTNLASTKYTIKKLICEDESIYDIMMKAYRKARGKTKKNYLPVMSGKKVSVIAKGKSSGVKLRQGVTITGGAYNDTTDNMVNRVLIYDDKQKKLGKVENKKRVETYGVYQQTHTKEDGVDAKSEAQAMMVGVTKEATIESFGDVKAISGYSIEIDDTATGIKGKFYITSDTHTFQGGTHMMTLELSEQASEEGAEDQTKPSKAKVTNASKCYYLEGSSVYHSKTSCTACKGKNTKKTTVAEIKKIKVTKGKNKGKRKFKPCSKCWET